ncbi:HAD hydrolase family protein [Rhizobium sp. NFACC06-2]|uniref:HAD hydrolase family protein n=1 Tax=Rhizobium sp. NFACC06-2 TaxID=1566264 RepID=UPI0008765FD4|nr:HAD hydrolase family protein [Rhizobium sp. NFACC06-2]SCY84373.1 Hydroxymethylpyrimidine pyrophosphatase [Rhizobium sp. NFACC06-2]
MWGLDIDGTLTAAGEHLPPAVVNFLMGISANVTLITAQSLDYCRQINAGGFPNLATEKGFTIRIKGIDRTRPAPPEVPGLVMEMEELISDLGGGLFINRKRAGYAVGYPRGARPEIFDKVVALMREQSERHEPHFVVEETAGFVDLTLRNLSKATALKAVMENFPGYSAIAAGDSPNTDGPMLKEAAHGVMVTNTLAPFPTVPGPDDMIALLAWFASLF